MITSQPLKGCIVGISVSGSEELRRLGFDHDEMSRCVVRLSEYLLAAGARLAFGHDWRPGGVMEAVAALAMRHIQISPEDEKEKEAQPQQKPPIINRVAAPDEPFLQYVRAKNEAEGIVHPAARLLEGVVDAQQTKESRGLDRPSALTAMREELAGMCDARICFGGKTEDFSGRWPGILEEAVLTLKRERPVYASCIFGGASNLVARALSHGKVELTTKPETEMKFKELTGAIADYAGKIDTGLNEVEEFRMWRSCSIDEIIELVLRGTVRVWERKRAKAEGR